LWSIKGKGRTFSLENEGFSGEGEVLFQMASCAGGSKFKGCNSLYGCSCIDTVKEIQ